MPARRSSFPKIEILLLLLLVPLLSAGCANRQVWGIPADVLAQRLAAGDYELLSTVDWGKVDGKEALALGSQAPYYLSIILESLRLPEPGRRMLELAWARSPRPWKEEAGALLAAMQLADRDYGRAAETARAALALKPDPAPALARRAQKTLAEALYWERKDEAALAEANRIDADDFEGLLFRAVGSMRLGRLEARRLFLTLFLRQKTSPLHGRAWPFLSSDPAYLAPFLPAERELLEAKYHFVQGSWAKGIGLMEGALRALEPARLDGAVVLADLAAASVSAGKQAEGARFIEALAGRLAGPARADALEQAGRLYRRAREYKKATAVLHSAAAASRLTEQQDRARWLVLDILLTTGPADLLEQLARESLAWNVPSFFSDLLEERIADLVAARAWGELARLWKVLEANGPVAIRAQLCYILARAGQEGLTARLPGSPPAAAQDLLREAVRLSPAGYYGTMAAALLGEIPPHSVPRDVPIDPFEPGAGPQSEQQGAQGLEAANDSTVEPAFGGGPLPDGGDSLDAVTLGFLSFGLRTRAYRRVWADRASLPETVLLDAARRLDAAGEYRGALTLLGYLRQRRGLSAAEQLLYYPRAFGPTIDSLAKEHSLAPHVLYALVREESYFDAGAVSSAGAIGLSQLMPATADQVARKLRIENPDLRDPATNLAIGARHLRDLLSSTGSVPRALLAYNAGLTRVRAWERAGSGLPGDLLVESVPFQESRGYVRKILLSAVMYARLYDGTDAGRAAAAFFGLEPAAPSPGQMAPR